MFARTLALALIAAPCLCLAQTPPPVVAARTAPQPTVPATSTPLPVRRVILYKTGVGYFEHLGRVRNRQDVTIRFTSAQLNDALKSLTTIDLGQGQITGISYNSVAPLEQRLGALRLPLGDEASSASLLGALRGARVEVTAGATTAAGRLLSVERTTRGTGPDRTEVQGVNSEITAEKVALWTGDRVGGTPLRAIWITNGSGLTLDGGSMSIVDSNAFAGEGLMEPLKPGERRLVSYAAELGMRVKPERNDAPARVVRVRAQQGVIIQEAEQRSTWTYTTRNENDAPATIVIEHRLRPGWKLAEGQAAAESTLNTHRFRLAVEPKKEATLVVREVRVEESRVAVGTLTDT